MKISNTSAKIAAAMALPLITSVAAQAHDNIVPGVPILSYSRSTDRETWRSVLLVSGILLIAGLVDDNGALILIGGAGVLVSLSHTNGSYYTSVGRGLEFAKVGPVSMGFNPFGTMRLSQGLNNPQPTVVVQAKFKF